MRNLYTTKVRAAEVTAAFKEQLPIKADDYDVGRPARGMTARELKPKRF